MKEPLKFIEVTMGISPKAERIGDMYHVKFEQDVVQVVYHNYFTFISTNMNTATAKVKQIVSNHPVNYFGEITMEQLT